MIRCDDCGTHAANVHLTQIVSGQVSVAHLCEECARKKGISISISTENAVAAATAQAPAAAQPEVFCDNCGLKFSDFRTKGWLGCPECYDKFEKEIDDILVQMHGSCVHKGKGYFLTASAPAPATADAQRLRSQLDKAIRDEEFELAAAIRDVLRSMALDGAHV